MVKKKKSAFKKTMFIFGTIILVGLLITGFIIGGFLLFKEKEVKTTFEDFRTICENTGGLFARVVDISLDFSVCDCSSIFPNFVDMYKDIKFTDYNGCRIA